LCAIATIPDTLGSGFPTVGHLEVGMRSLNFRLIAALVLSSGTILVAPLSASGVSPHEHFVFNHWARGAVGAFDTCVPETAESQLCQDFFVSYVEFGVTRDESSPAGEGFVLIYEHYAAHIFTDGTADEFIAETGSAHGVPGSFDTGRLRFAHAQAASIALADIDPDTGDLTPNGRTVHLGAFDWIAASGVYVFGNDGPFQLGPPRFTERCFTQIVNNHDRFTTAHVTGTIDGISVTQYGQAYLPWPGTGPADAYGAIFSDRFSLTGQAHGGSPC
jgi:hypothetical protein